MAKITDRIEERPYRCDACKHFERGLTCAAFDLIPDEIIENGAESHNHVMPGQNGDYIFETDQPRDTLRVYGDDDADPEP